MFHRFWYILHKIFKYYNLYTKKNVTINQEICFFPFNTYIHTISESFDYEFNKLSIRKDISIDKFDFLDFIKPLINNDKIVVSAYIRVFDNISSLYFF